jgi:error-prone DNA polymerase
MPTDRVSSSRFEVRSRSSSLQTSNFKLQTPLAYAELHCHSNFSFLDGTSDPKQLAEQAATLGLSAVALTDTNGLYGVVRFAAALQAHKTLHGWAPFAIIGAELLLEHGDQLVLLVCNLDGYRNLCWLINRAHRATLKPGDVRGTTLPTLPRGGGDTGAPPTSLPSASRLPAAPQPPLSGRGSGGEPESDEPRITLGDLDGHTQGLIALARPQADIDSRLTAYRDLFGATNLFVETQRHLIRGEGPRNETLRRAARALGLRCVATNDVHYATEDQAPLQDVVTAIRHRVPLEQAAQPHGDQPPLLFPNYERRLKSPKEMAQLFHAHPEELAVTVEIALRCTFELRELQYEFPRPTSLAKDADPFRVLIEAVKVGARTYYKGRITQTLRGRIIHELTIVQKLNLAGYLLTFKDIVDFCHRERILVSIRGSAPASVLLYCLGLCPIDPLEHGLLFERFASMERDELPDIDLDIAHEDRERVIQYVYETYGREQVAMVCEVNTYRARSAIRDVAFVLGLPQHQIDLLAKTVDLYDRGSMDVLLGGASLPVDERVAAELIALCRQLIDAPRHLSIHVGGMVISAQPLHQVVHSQPARMPKRTIIPWDKDDLTILAEVFHVNLIKLDLLGLGMLKLVSRIFETIEARGEGRPSLHGFRYDERVFDSICKGDTIGLFQIESRAQISFLPKLKPRNLSDVAISVGAIRPGPGACGAGEHIARRRNGQEPITYPHPDLFEPLRQTLGVLLWQEQAMQVANIMGGYTLGESEQLRRAMTHKRSHEAMQEICDELARRMGERGHPPELVQEIRQMVEGFAGYGFPRAHAYPFAHLALVSATLKLHYPAEYYAAILNSQPMGFYAPHTLIWDAARHGVKTLPVDVNESAWECTVVRSSKFEVRSSDFNAELTSNFKLQTSNSLRLGFTMVRGLGARAREVLERERECGPYRSIADFVRRTGLDRDAIERLAEVGAFLRFDERRAAIWRAGELAGLGGPGHLPGLADDLAERVPLPPMDTWELVHADYASLGLSPGQHLISFYRASLQDQRVRSAQELIALARLDRPPEQRPRRLRVDGVRVGGIVICRQRPETAKEFMFMTIEDETGLVNVIVQPRVYHAMAPVLRGEPLLVIEGDLQSEEGVIDIIARKAWTFEALGLDSAADRLASTARAVPAHNFR